MYRLPHSHMRPNNFTFFSSSSNLNNIRARCLSCCTNVLALSPTYSCWVRSISSLKHALRLVSVSSIRSKRWKSPWKKKQRKYFHIHCFQLSNAFLIMEGNIKKVLWFTYLSKVSLGYQGHFDLNVSVQRQSTENTNGFLDRCPSDVIGLVG